MNKIHANSNSRRDFIKVVTAAVGVIIGAGVGLPALDFLIWPALQK